MAENEEKTVKGVTLSDNQWITFMGKVTEEWVRDYIPKAYPGRNIVEIRWD